ncbi:MAG: CHASE4 domain-containing protein [Thiotrichales bacterium]
MSLRTKVISLLLALFGIYAGVNYLVQRQVVYPNFVELEREEAQKNVERAVEALQRELELLQPSVATWAFWDDTYHFISDLNEEYVRSNLNLEALESLQVQVLAFYNRDGQRIWGMSVDLDQRTELDPNVFLPQVLPSGHPLRTDAAETARVSGLMNQASGPMLFVSFPILTTERQGPSRGSVVMGRLLDDAAVARIASQTRIDLRIQAPPANARASAARGLHGTLAHTPIALTEAAAGLVGTTTLHDLNGQAAIDLVVNTPREITARGENALRFANLSTALAGALALVLILVLLRRTVFDPVSQLTAHATALGAHDALETQLNLNRRDEIGTLAKEFDRMVARLAETRQRLLDQSYRSGVAEMASGVLHNIGNAITPVSVKLTTLKQELQQAPLAEIEMARAELADPATPPERSRDLTQFLELAAGEVGNLVQRMTRALDTVQTQVSHVESILADQQRFSRAERVLEPLALGPVVAETVELLPESLRGFTTVEIDPALMHQAPVFAARVALQQVINNLLINAAESIRESGQGADTGRIVIRAVGDTDDATVHLCVEDNGIGIAEENLARLFERGYSTKARGSGMGLHWSANTVSAMGGQLYVRSAGIGRGARMHLLLASANASMEQPGIAA